MELPSCVDDFRRIGTESPDAVAVTHNGHTTTYSDLIDEIQALAEELIAAGVHGPVAVPAVRSRHTIAALFALHLAGAAYCPVDPVFPEQRRAAMLAAVGCRYALRPDPNSPRPGVHQVGVHHPARPSEIDGGDTAYVLFTSGSTGTPKPVAVPHTAISTSVRGLRELLEIGPHDRLLQFASLSWDTCFEEILTALTGGATLVIDDDAHSGSFARFLRMLAGRQITVLNLPTAFWHELVGYLEDTGQALPECVRTVVIGGEQVSQGRLAAWRKADTGRIRLINTYGCTETVLVTHAVDLSGPRASMPHVRQLVRDDGELLVSGPGLATGYPGSPEATAERFVRPPQDPANRYFRTGDLVEVGDDGLLTMRGRADRQLKIRGIRVDPAEVESVISRHPAVAATAVVGATIAGRTVLVAYVVGRVGGQPGLAELVLADLRAQLPGHLVPGRIIAVDELGYTPNGKVDYVGLAQRGGAKTGVRT
jgi:nonribosomal peptide synthetase protein VioO